MVTKEVGDDAPLKNLNTTFISVIFGTIFDKFLNPELDK